MITGDSSRKFDVNENPVYELVLDGWSSEEPDTDDLIKWVRAPSPAYAHHFAIMMAWNVKAIEELNGWRERNLSIEELDAVVSESTMRERVRYGFRRST